MKRQENKQKIGSDTGSEMPHKAIYIDIDEELPSILEKIDAGKVRNLYLVIPERSKICQSAINLKILKKRAEGQGKKIVLLTNDYRVANFANQENIALVNKVSANGEPSLFSMQDVDDKLRITPLKASVNSLEEEGPTRLAEKKLSIGQLLKNSKGGNRKVKNVSRVESPIKTSAKKDVEKERAMILGPNRHALISLVVISLFILMIIIYIALPGVTIYLTPAASVIEKSLNVTLADPAKNAGLLQGRTTQAIASYPVTVEVSATVEHDATGKQLSANSKNATGKLVVYNENTTSWPLVEKTRFQTNDGLVFRIREGVTIPAAKDGKPGQLEVSVFADALDANEEPIGDRGNIAPSKLFLPGLSEANREKIYAENLTPMTGGTSDQATYVSRQDLEAAKSKLEKDLLAMAIEQMELEVETMSAELSEGEYVLLEGDGALKMDDVRVRIPEGLEGSEADNFELEGSLRVRGVFYDQNQMLDILRNELMAKKSPQKELVRINDSSASYRIFEWDEAGGRIKVTANIKGIEQFDISPESSNGKNLLRKIKERIAGKEIAEAEDYIRNLPEINKVEIDSWPAWAPTIPKIMDNIEFEVKPALTAG